MGRSHDTLCNTVPVVASFLAEKSKSKAYSTVNIYRSTLSSVLERIDGLPIGQHPEIILLRRTFLIEDHLRPNIIPLGTSMWFVLS